MAVVSIHPRLYQPSAEWFQEPKNLHESLQKLGLGVRQSQKLHQNVS